MKGLYALVGMQFRSPEERAHFATLPTGSPLMLKREPTNQYDSNAVQVWSGAFHIGFISSKQNKPLAMAMDAMPAAVAGAPVVNIYRQKAAKLAIDGGRWPLVEIEE